MIRFLQRHRTVGRVVARRPVKAWIADRVWAELEADPAFNAAMEQGRADLAAGRFTEWKGQP